MSKISGIRRLAAFGGHWKILFAFMVTVICASASCPDTPDGQITVTNDWFSATRTSFEAFYNLDCYHYYVVDITIPGGISGSFTIDAGFSPSTQLTQANCADASTTIFVYKRSGNTALLPPSPWVLINNQGPAKGTWVSGLANYCALPYEVFVNGPGSNVLGYDEYLVQVLPTLFGVATQAQISIGRTPQPPR